MGGVNMKKIVSSILCGIIIFNLNCIVEATDVADENVFLYENDNLDGNQVTNQEDTSIEIDEQEEIQEDGEDREYEIPVSDEVPVINDTTLAEENSIPDAVTGLKAISRDDGSILVKWNSLQGADGYIVYRKTGGETKMTYRCMATTTGFIDNTASKDTYTFYRVYPFIKNEEGKMITGNSLNYVYTKACIKLGPVKNLKAQVYRSSYVKLNWSSVDGAAGYIISRKNNLSGKFVNCGNTTSTSFIDSTAAYDEFNFYRVYPYYKDDSGKVIPGQSDTYKYVKPMQLPPVVDIKAEYNDNTDSIEVMWDVDYEYSCKGTAEYNSIDGYHIFRRTGDRGDFTYLSTVEGNVRYYHDEEAPLGTNVYYQVYPYKLGKNGVKSSGPCVSFSYTKMKAPRYEEIVSISQIDQVRIMWRTKNGMKPVDGYDVFRNQEGNFYKYIGTTKQKVYIDKSASKTKVNNYKVYPFRIINGKKEYSKCEEVVSGKALNYSLNQAIADYGWDYIGTPYVWGGNDLNKGVDCSGFVQQIHLRFGIKLSRTTYTMEYEGRDIGRDLSQAMPGDVICYCPSLGEPSHHVAIYVGNGMMIHSTSGYNWWDGKKEDGIQFGKYADYLEIKTIRRFW